MPPVGFEPTIPESARPQIYALDRAATGIGLNWNTQTVILRAAIYDTWPSLHDHSPYQFHILIQNNLIITSTQQHP
jgi:hypothetical protein